MEVMIFAQVLPTAPSGRLRAVLRALYELDSEMAAPNGLDSNLHRTPEVQQSANGSSAAHLVEIRTSPTHRSEVDQSGP